MVQKTGLAIVSVLAVIGLALLFSKASITGDVTQSSDLGSNPGTNVNACYGCLGAWSDMVVDGNPQADKKLDQCCGKQCRFVLEQDGDSFQAEPCGDDCADANPNVNPGAVEVCDDDLDNDCDGARDCADTECSFDPACVASINPQCSNKIDDNNNGLTDCADPLCFEDPVCVDG
jgi:hypothetical protein